MYASIRSHRSMISASAILAAVSVLPALAAPKSSSSGVIDALQKKYTITETTPDFEQITRDGTTMAMKTAGVYSIPANLVIKPDNQVVDGKVKTPGMMVRMMWTKSGAHVLQNGDKVYVTKIDSKSESGGDTLRFGLLTVDALDVSGSESKKKYDAYVSFKFKKGYLDEPPPEEVEQAVEAVLAPDTGDDAKGGDKADAGAQAPAHASAPKAAAPAPAVAAVAPAPAPAAPPPTISIGESSTEVLQAMGMPLQMIDLGKKKMYVYKAMKITFINDKVADMQ
ncbi:MAG TPA: hypothetical protein VGD62_01765 [Acidobacteriaceae bacterium]